ncbi:MAG: AraC family transcriptional regulator [Lachnospiraceae bacterium]|nr:AraC family transcriptional regulator [Lachnospiraceae bacterium]
MIGLSFPRQVIAERLYPLFQSNSVVADFFAACLYEEGFSSCLRFTIGKNEKLRKLPELMDREQDSPDKYSAEIMTDLLQVLLHMLLRVCPESAVYLPASPIQKESAEIIRRISADYANITLKSLAAEMGYSVGYCSRYIKQVTGRNFADILANIRFKAAEHLLADTDTCLCDISCSLGYKNPENFFRSFKKKYGITPGQYRERERTA